VFNFGGIVRIGRARQSLKGPRPIAPTSVIARVASLHVGGNLVLADTEAFRTRNQILGHRRDGEVTGPELGAKHVKVVGRLATRY